MAYLGRNFVTLKIFTEQGVYGIGDATLNGRELSVVSYLEDHIVPCLIGIDPRRIEGIWQHLYRGAYWRRGPVTMGCGLHFDSWAPNFGIQEYMRHTEEADAVFLHDCHFKSGELFCGETPGHSVDSDEALAAEYPYKPADLPVARLEDGTMSNW